jgi:hypothetical protein
MNSNLSVSFPNTGLQSRARKQAVSRNKGNSPCYK